MSAAAREKIDLLDFTLLNEEATTEELSSFIATANDHHPAAVCVFAKHILPVKVLLAPSISLAAVAGGFPIGSESLEELEAGIQKAIESGADEIDCVLEPPSASTDEKEVVDISSSSSSSTIMKPTSHSFPGVKEAAILKVMRHASKGKLLKVIIETPLLTDAQIRQVTRLVLQEGADFVKSCTGKRGGCTPAVARILAEEVKAFYLDTQELRGIKLSGGIKSSEDANALMGIVMDVQSQGTHCPTRFRIGASSLMHQLVPLLENTKEGQESSSRKKQKLDSSSESLNDSNRNTNDCGY